MSVTDSSAWDFQIKKIIERNKLSNQQTPRGRVFPEKLIDPKLVKKFPALYGTRRFITAFTRGHHLSVSWVRSEQSMPRQLISSILILSLLRWSLQICLFPSGLSTRTLDEPLLSPYTSYMPRKSHSSRFNHPNKVWWRVQITELLIIVLFSIPLVPRPS